MTWSQFLKAHWNVLVAADFFTVEVWGPCGLVTFYVFFVIELATRRIEIAGITPGPNEAWMMQIGRNLTDPFDGFLEEKRYLILDRDGKYSVRFRDLLKDAGVEVVRLPPRSPNDSADCCASTIEPPRSRLTCRFRAATVGRPRIWTARSSRAPRSRSPD